MEMPWFGRTRSRGAVLFAVGWGMLVACGGGASNPEAPGAPEAELQQPCGVDEVREYYCDDLMPLSSSRPAPKPYDNCPAAADVRHGSFPAVSRVATFDTAFTAYTRKRVPPGHSCCYGWCAKVTVADPSQAKALACQDAAGLPESFCMRELEAGSSTPAANPFERCPGAVKPPEAVAFSVPSSALLDVNQTSQRRRDRQLPDCCYAWCSKAPTGTVLKRSQPKTK